jgi:hypothetical protein
VNGQLGLESLAAYSGASGRMAQRRRGVQPNPPRRRLRPYP